MPTDTPSTHDDAASSPDPSTHGAPWMLWGPYLAERQWGTVREDASEDGEAWAALTHDMARSVAYRWGEDGIGGISDEHQRLCLSLALWNGQDPILKERLFGLSNAEGNHGEDVKEQYWYLDNLPDHRWMRMVYRYPQAAFPYTQLVAENARRGRAEPEYELADTGIFAAGRYFDVEIACAKAGEHDLLLRYTAHNRGPDDAPLHLLPTLWFRADPAANGDMPAGLSAGPDGALLAQHATLGRYTCHVESDGGVQPQWLFTDNATNPARAEALGARSWPTPPGTRGCFKDAFHERVVHGNTAAVSADPRGSKACAWFSLQVPAGGSVSVRLRLCREPVAHPFADFDGVMTGAQAGADTFYAHRQNPAHTAEQRALQRQAWAGLLWSKQFYAYDVSHWLDGEAGCSALPAARKKGRNAGWRHMRAHDIVLMPDKWEYPWFASWDLAFHAIAVAPVDPALAKRQLTLLLHDRYMHPNGQIPAYEWNFGDANPPVQALAAWKVYQTDAAVTGTPDTAFLRHVLHRLMLNFTWWVNRQDASGNNIFQGGFLGLDNVGVFDRSQPLPGGGVLEQADGTSWMAMYALNLMRIAMELAVDDPVYEDLAIKFGEHFFYIAGAMANMGGVDGAGLWDEEDGFYYDQVKMPDGNSSRLRLRTVAGLIPFLAVEVLDAACVRKLGRLRHHLQVFLQGRPDLAALVSHWQEPHAHGTAGQANGNSLHLFSLLRGHRMKRVLRRVLDEKEFLSPHGIRSVSKAYGEQAFDYALGDTHYGLHYTPAESDNGMFGGNSNWRGPVWIPLNYLIVESLRRFHSYYGDDFLVECPTGSGQMMSIRGVADFLQARLLSLYLPGAGGQRTGCGAPGEQQATDGMLLFHEYFHGDTGRGLGASHQTGWTALLAVLL